MALARPSTTIQNVATWLGLLGGAAVFLLSCAYFAGQTQNQIAANHLEAMAKLDKIEKQLPALETARVEIGLQIQHIRDTCCPKVAGK